MASRRNVPSEVSKPDDDYTANVLRRAASTAAGREALMAARLRFALATAVQRVLDKKQISIREAARRMKTSPAVIHRILERENDRSVTLKTLTKLAAAVDARLWVEFIEAEEEDQRILLGEQFCAKWVGLALNYVDLKALARDAKPGTVSESAVTDPSSIYSTDRHKCCADEGATKATARAASSVGHAFASYLVQGPRWPKKQPVDTSALPSPTTATAPSTGAGPGGASQLLLLACGPGS